MKKLLFTTFALTIFLFSNVYSQTSKVNVEKSKVHWLGKKITGQHDGFIKISSGSIEFKEGNITNGEFVMDMNSITCSDLEDENYNKKLVDHLKSDDFFGVKKFPKAKLVITKASKFTNDKCSVEGNLTIKGKTELIKFDVNKKKDVYSAVMKVDRSKYDVRFGSTSFFDSLGNKAIDDIFTLTIDLAVI